MLQLIPEATLKVFNKQYREEDTIESDRMDQEGIFELSSHFIKISNQMRLINDFNPRLEDTQKGISWDDCSLVAREYGSIEEHYERAISGYSELIK